jgi:hypothetical protein
MGQIADQELDCDKVNEIQNSATIAEDNFDKN